MPEAAHHMPHASVRTPQWLFKEIKHNEFWARIRHVLPRILKIDHFWVDKGTGDDYILVAPVWSETESKQIEIRYVFPRNAKKFSEALQFDKRLERYFREYMEQNRLCPLCDAGKHKIAVRPVQTLKLPQNAPKPELPPDANYTIESVFAAKPKLVIVEQLIVQAEPIEPNDSEYSLVMFQVKTAEIEMLSELLADHAILVTTVAMKQR